MSKHKQTKSLGNLGNFTTPPEQKPMSVEAEITALKDRVSTLEMLLNDVMHQLDKPTKHEPKRHHSNQKEAKPPPPKQKQASTQTKEEPKTNEKIERAQAASAQANAEATEKLKAHLSDKKRRTEAEIREALGFSKNMFKRIRGQVKNDGNPDRDERLYFMV
ncbi:hypothetical protein F4X90_06340 [Candidatus Poribacteria bacterium]|nr:hypothetical protein [Candidatus Poribacteria bacterium]